MRLLKKSKKRILVVDDEPMIVEMTCNFLKDEGFEACGAANTAEALAEMKKQPADVIVLDVFLSSNEAHAFEDGLTFLKMLKKLYPEVPVVILTGAGYDEGMMQTALDHGADGYLSKETEMENLLIAIKRLVK